MLMALVEEQRKADAEAGARIESLLKKLEAVAKGALTPAEKQKACTFD